LVINSIRESTWRRRHSLVAMTVADRRHLGCTEWPNVSSPFPCGYSCSGCAARTTWCATIAPNPAQIYVPH
jgi:hypothetical protein